MNRLTDWRFGDVVRMIAPQMQHARGEHLPEGSIGVLGKMYRIQDGVECWAFWQGAKLSAIAHTYAERCFGPVKWRSCFSMLEVIERQIANVGPYKKHEHKAISARFIPHGAASGYRRTGVEQIERCTCGATRHVWITTFKVETGAWDTEGNKS